MNATIWELQNRYEYCQWASTRIQLLTVDSFDSEFDRHELISRFLNPTFTTKTLLYALKLVNKNINVLESKKYF